MSNTDQISIRQRIRRHFSELRRRHVVQVTSVYLVAAWGLSAGAADIFDVLNIPQSAVRYFIILLFALTPVVVVVSWFFEIDKGGIYRDHGDADSANDTTHLVVDSERPSITASFKDVSRSFAADFTVGRDEGCEFQIIDPLISRQHTRFERIEGRWRIRDLGSANGTTVDGEKVDSAWLSGEMKLSFYPGCPAFTVTSIADTTADTVFVDQ